MIGKYIILENGLPVILPSASNHNSYFQKKDCRSAGFFSYSNNTGFKCYGESESLGLSSEKDDHTILNVFFKFHKY
jgi:hypothetical protein